MNVSRALAELGFYDKKVGVWGRGGVGFSGYCRKGVGSSVESGVKGLAFKAPRSRLEGEGLRCTIKDSRLGCRVSHCIEGCYWIQA